MRALLLANSNDCDPGYTGERFRHHGYSFIECHRERPNEWPTLDGIDQVVLLGSDWSVYWPHIADEVAAELTLIRTAHALGVPVYGICFGAQSMAAALGGTVVRAPEPEIGWHNNVVSKLPDAIAAGPWMQWHYDVLTVPPGAEELAHSPLAPQAFRLGRSFATQFHPEATDSILARWSSGKGGDELRAQGIDVADLRVETASNVLMSRPNACRIVDWYVEHVAGS